MSLTAVKVLIVSVVTIVFVAWGIGIDWNRSDSRVRTIWQQAVAPGPLSQSHVFLSDQCVACHTPVKGVEPALCISCHANNTALLQRQPTVFHASVPLCVGCHVEHQGSPRMPTAMDHSLLAKAGHEMLRKPNPEVTRNGAQALPASHPPSAMGEQMLDCASCHATKDRHLGHFGTDCVQCHQTTQWTMAQFVHPSARSTECAQCHRPPPSHNMMHFSMMSAPLAQQPNAKVDQCFMCHQTTVWNDIKGVGWKKVH